MIGLTRQILKKSKQTSKLLSTRIRTQNSSKFSIASLHFNQPAHQTPASADENRRRYTHQQELNRQQYRRLTESADLVRELMPRLIGHTLRRKTAVGTLSAEEAAAEVKNLY